jgi:trans-2,3-dihydro-3-hydroxyanthranilate isomerase
VHDGDVLARALGLLCLFTREKVHHDANVHSRLFAPAYGIVEDPATGSAAGCLAAYCLEHGYLGDDPISASIEQGLEMGRPSRLKFRASRTESGQRIEVGGHSVLVASGVLQEPK